MIMGLKTFTDRKHHVPLTAHAPGSGLLARILKTTVDVAYWVMATATLIAAIAFVAAIFVPLSQLSVTIDTGTEARQMPLSRSLLLFAIGLSVAYFAGFFIILRQLRRIFASLLMGDPFQPKNVSRLQRIGIALTLVAIGGWIAQTVAARHLAPGAIEAPGISELFTPGFAVIIVFVLSEVFREGTRLRRESEMTI